jgi:hypothetical protein
VTIDITDASDSRFTTGVEAFTEGWSITYHGLHVCVHDGTLLISAQSEWQPPNLTESFARTQFAAIQSRFGELLERSSAFARYVRDLPCRFVLMEDYGMGAVALCHTDGDRLVAETGFHFPNSSNATGSA